MTTASALARLLKPVAPLSALMSIADVADRLLTPEHKAFLSLPIVDAAGKPLGLVSRSTLQDIFMQRFGRDLRGRHPVEEVMNPAPLVVSLETNLEDAAKQITAQLQYPITEDFILVDAEGLYRGLGTVLDLLKAMEARIAQRNQVLRKALVDLKESQTQLVQSEKMASLGQMVAGVAHELNTPLGYVTNNVQLLRELSAPLFELADAQAALGDCLSDPACDETRLAEALETAAEARAKAAPELLVEDFTQLFSDTLYGLEQIAELVVGLKDFARLDRAMSEEVDLNECIRSALVIARNGIKDKAETILQLGDLPRIPCAPSQINQVLLNLLNNAAQAIEGFGQIVVKTWADESAVFISVRDTGRGMTAEVLARIFDPFFTTKPVGEGTGLGLSISYKIIQDHGGQIRAVSEPGRGTRFLIRLPRPQALPLQRSA
ncbi:MAG: CBS domain-containing protein [Gammaproteobacteria bacterium]|nr:CBS domain-containing protein [Gammaproteobacteria bacterium]MBU1492069.1 CBS domain-containing protein [Gammaproteobacteria bacterium]MBU2139287.1 CBS domain-containing protein [Gammaproteobacteria bacterium]MBU2216611.1 CBS domain-containing protein [Gammaproteobacteria bacterium]MBU2324885.1 CBS domain-containing protein [Gammaproteobacteria bacterium]